MAERQKWTRPESVSVPTVWRRFEGRRPLANGQVPRFRVQDYTDDMKTEVLSHMVSFYMEDEPLSRHLKMPRDPVAVAELRGFWEQNFQHKLVLVVILDNAEELEDKTLPRLAGCNMTTVMHSDSPEPQLKSSTGRDMIGTVNAVGRLCDCFKLYNVTEYLYAVGLSVNPVYRGQGVGLNLLEARSDVCRAVGLKATVTMFSAIASQKLAAQAGFDTLAELLYDDYRSEEGEAVLKGMTPKSCKLMGKRIE